MFFILFYFIFLIEPIRHFLNENLPRIQYNNPQVEYEVNKVADANIKPTVTLHFRKLNGIKENNE